MKFKWAARLLLVSLILGSCPSFALLKIDDQASTRIGESPLDITTELETSIEDREALDFKTFNYQPHSQPDLKLPYTSKALWARLQIENTKNQDWETYLYWTTALAGKVELYDESSEMPLQKAGSIIPYRERALPFRVPVFKITLKPGETKTLYMKRTAIHNLSTRVHLAKPEVLLATESDSKALLFFYLGGILCLILYNVFIGFYSRDSNYFLYAMFAGSFCASVLNSHGFFDAFAFRNLPFSISQYLMVFSSVAIFSALAFAYRFLNIAQYFPKSKIYFGVLAISAAVTLINGLFPIPNSQVVFGHLVDLTIVSMVIFLITCGFVVYNRGYILARFFLLSWLSVFFGILGWFGMTYGLFRNTSLTSSALMIGNMGEMLILSLGLAYKINILDSEKKEALTRARDKEKYHRLVKVLSHDIANSIMLFGAYLQRLKNQVMASSGDLQVVGKLESLVKSMEDMLSLVRSEETLKSFKLSVSLQPVELLEVLHEVVSFYEDRTVQKSLKVDIQVPAGTFIMADRTALANQVLSNLISNAVKFSYPQSKICIRLENQSQWSVLRIEDKGCGIPEENINRIFFSDEILSQPGTIRERGSGLGCSLVQQYMKIFNGRIEVISVHESKSKDSGTTICLYFPRA